MRQSADYQSRESGGVLGFVIVTLVLIGLLAGGLWFIKNRHDVAAKVDTVSQAAKDQATNNKDETTTTNPDSSTGAGTSNNSGNTSSTPAKPAPTTPAQQPAPSQPAQPAAPAAPTTVATTGPSHIASTGPTDVIVNAFLFAGLLVVGYLYRQSRHHAA